MAANMTITDEDMRTGLNFSFLVVFFMNESITRIHPETKRGIPTIFCVPLLGRVFIDIIAELISAPPERPKSRGFFSNDRDIV